MPRRHSNVYRRYSSEANRESRKKSTLKIVRMVSPENTSEINGVIHTLLADNTLPVMDRVPGSHPLFVLDPRQVRKEFNNGFRVGFDCYRAKVDAENQNGNRDEIEASIGGLTLRGNKGRNLLFAKVDAPELTYEMLAYFSILGSYGLRGFEKRSHNTPRAPEIFLGKFSEYPSRSVQEEIIEAVDTGFAIHNIDNITLGPSRFDVID